VEPRAVDRHLYAAVGQLRRAHERAHRERREASLEVVDRLALVGRDAGDVHEPGDLVRAAGDRDHGPAIRMADEHHGTFDLVDDQATFWRWLRPRASTTWAWTGATSSLALSEPNGAPTTVRTARLPLA